MSYEQRFSFHFEAAHQLAHNVYDDDHPYAHIHGHSFQVTLYLRGDEVGPKGWLCDFSTVRDTADRIRATLDHRLLNDIEGLETPTLENLARYIYEKAAAELAPLRAVEVARPSLNESVRYDTQ